MARYKHDRFQLPPPNMLQKFGCILAYSLGGFMSTTTIAMTFHALLGLTIHIGLTIFTWDILNEVLEAAIYFVCAPCSLLIGYSLRDDREAYQK